MKDEQTTRVKVWDLPTRAFHWLIVALVAYLWWTERSDDIARHKLAGFALIGLLVFRLYWGIVGSDTSRFSNFVKGPTAIWRYLRGRAGKALGHNPLGAWSVVALLGLLVAECGLGLFAIDEDGLEAGPLAPMVGLDWAQTAARWHALLFDVLLWLVALHVVAIAYYAARGDNLVFPMITGHKRVEAGAAAPRIGSRWLSLFGLALGAAAFYWLYRLDQ